MVRPENETIMIPQQLFKNKFYLRKLVKEHLQESQIEQLIKHTDSQLKELRKNKRRKANKKGSLPASNTMVNNPEETNKDFFCTKNPTSGWATGNNIEELMEQRSEIEYED
jgi:molybdopterin-biosynthesis enzyme MoeA-like protein